MEENQSQVTSKLEDLDSSIEDVKAYKEEEDYLFDDEDEDEDDFDSYDFEPEEELEEESLDSNDELVDSLESKEFEEEFIEETDEVENLEEEVKEESIEQEFIEDTFATDSFKMNSTIVEVPVIEEEDTALEEFIPPYDVSSIESSMDTEEEILTQIELSPMEETKEIEEELAFLDNETYDPEFEPKDTESIVLQRSKESIPEPVRPNPVSEPEPQRVEEPVVEEKSDVAEQASFVIQETNEEENKEDFVAEPDMEQTAIESTLPMNAEQNSFEQDPNLVPNPYFRSKKMLPKKKAFLLYSSAVLIFLCLIVSIFVVIYVYK